MNNSPHVLLINPWIHDFAAYDFWAKPFGVLVLAALLRHHDIKVSYIDCLDRFHPRMTKTNPKNRNGRGPYLKSRIPKPLGLIDIQRHYSRYGIKPAWFWEDIKKVSRPDLILVTSMMTYWYPGVHETIKILRQHWPDVPLVLGGIYATLCHEHARLTSGADLVFKGQAETSLLKLVEQFTGYHPRDQFDPDNLNTYPFPAFDLQTHIGYVPLLTSKGCPFSCVYCAAKVLNPDRRTRQPDKVVEEIVYWHHQWGVKDFVFYDDALLMQAEKHAAPLFEGVIRAGLKIQFHTPNALHIRWLTREMADLMYRAGFKTIRLGLETTSTNQLSERDTKASMEEYHQAIASLQAAGFHKNQIGVYLMVGLPNQSQKEIIDSIQTVKNSKAQPLLAHYTPIPHTALWRDAVTTSRYDLPSDPIYTNNAIFPCQKDLFSWQTISRLKALASE